LLLSPEAREYAHMTSDIVAIFADPAQLVARLAKPPETRHPIDRCVHGLLLLKQLDNHLKYFPFAKRIQDKTLTKAYLYYNSLVLPESLAPLLASIKVALEGWIDGDPPLKHADTKSHLEQVAAKAAHDIEFVKRLTALMQKEQEVKAVELKPPDPEAGAT
jgi:hypothetical protein